MVSKVVLLELLVVGGQILVVEEVVGHVVKGVAKDTTAEGGSGSVPVVKQDGVGKLPEGSGQDDKEGGRHDEAVPVHGQVVMNAVKEEVRGDADAVIREVARKKRVSACSSAAQRVCEYSLIKVEQEAMQNVLNQRPESEAKSEIAGHGSDTAKALECDGDTVRDGRPPD